MQNLVVLKKNPNIVSRTIEDETILMPIYKTSDEINCIYALNEVAARIWKLIDGKKNLGKIKKTLSEEFDATEKELNKKLDKFLKDLKEIKAIKG
ncbi:MAG: PqqD family protein [Candidatus Omnitrophota bacterium]|nr:PqqD family protein [Candidatus Omnitrophota bacterium]